jgi:DNA-directed RNA polymerase subunit F
MTMQEFYRAAIKRAIRTGETLDQIVNGIQPETINDMRALLKMLRTDVLPEPARSLAEKLRRTMEEAAFNARH